jgi:hypothetical protein
MEITEQHAADLSGEEKALQLVLDMQRALSQSQSALLGSDLEEFARCTARQQELGRELQKLISANPHAAEHKLAITSELIFAAQGARNESRLFAAVLRRMRRNLEILSAAVQGTSYLYTQPRTSEKGA